LSHKEAIIRLKVVKTGEQDEDAIPPNWFAVDNVSDKKKKTLFVP
jgi:hypothetical protein